MKTLQTALCFRRVISFGFGCEFNHQSDTELSMQLSPSGIFQLINRQMILENYNRSRYHDAFRTWKIAFRGLQSYQKSTLCLFGSFGGFIMSAGEAPEDLDAPYTDAAPSGQGQASGGAWHLQAVYNIGDTCTHEGITYQCRQAHTVHSPDWIPPNTPALWQPIESNEWQHLKTYAVGEACTYEGNTYECRQAHTAHAANWTPPNTLNLWAPK